MEIANFISKITGVHSWEHRRAHSRTLSSTWPSAGTQGCYPHSFGYKSTYNHSNSTASVVLHYMLTHCALCRIYALASKQHSLPWYGSRQDNLAIWMYKISASFQPHDGGHTWHVPWESLRRSLYIGATMSTSEFQRGVTKMLSTTIPTTRSLIVRNA